MSLCYQLKMLVKGATKADLILVAIEIGEEVTDKLTVIELNELI